MCRTAVELREDGGGPVWSKMIVRTSILALLLFACALLAYPACADTPISLNGDWQFRVDPKGLGESGNWWKTLPDATQTIRVPHTWNVGALEDYEGVAWYFKSFDLPTELHGKHFEIHFGATFYKSRVWLNGVELGSHDGGHTSYYFVLPENLPQNNFLAVAIDNRPTAKSIPGLALRNTGNLWYDWWHYGGIVRDVWLTVNDDALIRRQHIEIRIQGRDAVITDHVTLENFSNRPVPVTISLSARLEGGGSVPAVQAEKKYELPPGKQQIEIEFRLPSVRLWNLDQPNLYDLDARLLDSKTNELDSLSDHFGARTIEIRDQRLYLNGEQVRLTGMTRHEDSPDEGLAETQGTWRHDYDDLKKLQVTLTRPVHYPQLPAILDYCDRNGILLVPEIPLWQFGHAQLGDPDIRSLAKQIFQEMWDQDSNHPSIFAWSVCNECEIHSTEGIEYFQQMHDWIRTFDPDRPVTFADDQLPQVKDPAKSATRYADFIMWNEYFGTWHGPENALRPAIDVVHKNFPDKMVIISEFGVPGVFAENSEKADEMRSRLVHEQLEEFAKHDWIAGAIFWCYQDYRSHRNLWPGYTEGYVDHGVVDENRQRRPSYQVWKEENSPVRVILEWTRDSNYPYAPSGFSAHIERRSLTDLPSYTVRDYRAVWELRDEKNQLVGSGEKSLGEVGSPITIEQALEKPASAQWTLSFDIYRPTGFLASRNEVTWRDVQPGGEDVQQMQKKKAISLPSGSMPQEKSN